MRIFAALALCSVIAGCGGVEEVSLREISPEIRTDKGTSRRGVNRPRNDSGEALMACIESNAFLRLMRGNAGEDSLGRFFQFAVPGGGEWRHPQLVSATKDRVQFYSSISRLSVSEPGVPFHSRNEVVFAEVDLGSGKVFQEVVRKASHPEFLPESIAAVVGDWPRLHAVIGDWLIVSDKGTAVVERIEDKKIEAVTWPADHGPYWNVRGLGEGWIAWDRSKNGRVQQGLGRISETGSLEVSEIPVPLEENVHQVGILRLQSGNFLWLEWWDNWGALAEWDAIGQKISRVMLGEKVLPALAPLKQGPSERFAVTDGTEFRILERTETDYEIVKRFTPAPSHMGTLKLSGEFKLHGVGARLYVSGKTESGYRRVMEVEEKRLRAMSPWDCRNPDFIFTKTVF